MTLTRFLKSGAVVLAAAIGFTGCIQLEDKNVLGKDGSGTAEVNVTLDLSKIEQVTEMFKGMMGGGEPAAEGETPKEPEIVSDWSEEKIREKLKAHPGIELVKYAKEKKDGKQIVNAQFKYKDIVDYAKADLLGNKAIELIKNEDGSWTLKFDPNAGQGDKMGGGGGGDDAGMGEAEAMGGGDPSMMIGMLEPFLGTFELKSKITVPGTITETNGTKDGESTVSWTYNWKALMESMQEKKPVAWSVSFKGEDITLKPFKHKPDAEGMANKYGK